MNELLGIGRSVFKGIAKLRKKRKELKGLKMRLGSVLMQIPAWLDRFESIVREMRELAAELTMLRDEIRAVVKKK